MKENPLNTNKQRRSYWNNVVEKYSVEEISSALRNLKPQYSEVIKLFYQQNLSLTEIMNRMKLSVTSVRNYHNRGIYLLYRYFNPRVPFAKDILNAALSDKDRI